MQCGGGPWPSEDRSGCQRGCVNPGLPRYRTSHGSSDASGAPLESSGAAGGGGGQGHRDYSWLTNGEPSSLILLDEKHTRGPPKLTMPTRAEGRKDGAVGSRLRGALIQPSTRCNNFLNREAKHPPPQMGGSGPLIPCAAVMWLFYAQKVACSPKEGCPGMARPRSAPQDLVCSGLTTNVEWGTPH